MYLNRNFGLIKTFAELIAKSKLAKFGLSDSLSKITLLFDLSLDWDRTLAQRKAQRKAKSKFKWPNVYPVIMIYNDIVLSLNVSKQRYTYGRTDRYSAVCPSICFD